MRTLLIAFALLLTAQAEAKTAPALCSQLKPAPVGESGQLLNFTPAFDMYHQTDTEIEAATYAMMHGCRLNEGRQKQDGIAK